MQRTLLISIKARPFFQPRWLTALLSVIASAGAGCGAPSSAKSAGAKSVVSGNASGATSPIVDPDASPQGNDEASFLISQAVRAIDSDFPDPSALREGNTFYAYATNTSGSNIAVATSTDLVQWKRLPDALPSLPAWAKSNSGLTWAPDVHKIATGSYVMYFTARYTSSGKQCIGVATATTPTGPFTCTTTAPLVCQFSIGGTIDASSFVTSDGHRYLIYKNDGNCCGFATRLWGRELSADGLTFIGAETPLLSADQAWEHNLIESPAMIEQGDQFYLFYSAAAYNNNTYATGVAVASSPLGPFEKIGNGLFLASDGGNLNGPGGLTPVRDSNGLTYAFFHSWNSSAYNYRSFWVAPLTWKDGAPKAQIE